MTGINQKRVAIMLYRLKFGGAERVMLTLAEAFIKRGLIVDLVLLFYDAKGEFLASTPDGINIINLDALGMLKAAKQLSHYIDRHKPDSIIANGDRCTMAAYLARKRTSIQPRILTVVHNDLIGPLSLVSPKHRFLAKIKKIPMSYIYPKLDKVVAVSNGVADSIAKFLNYPRKAIEVIYNPIDIEGIREKAKEPTNHPWFDKNDRPIVISVGRLSPEKDFSTLIKAFALLLEKTPARLVIIGEGPERPYLERLIEALDIGDSVALLGFQDNPYKFVKRADLFVMSSIFEGFGMVIAEAMILGAPVVSTDCPSGPAELLVGHPERLVPVGDTHSLSNAMYSYLINDQNVVYTLDSFSLEKVGEAYYQQCFSYPLAAR